MTRRYYLKKDRIIAAIDARHLCQAGFAADLGLSRSHWSQVLNGHRSATPRVRRALVNHPVLRDLAEDELWDVVVDAAVAA